jgi:hypothetical protein
VAAYRRDYCIIYLLKRSKLPLLIFRGIFKISPEEFSKFFTSSYLYHLSCDNQFEYLTCPAIFKNYATMFCEHKRLKIGNLFDWSKDIYFVIILLYVYEEYIIVCHRLQNLYLKRMKAMYGVCKLPDGECCPLGIKKAWIGNKILNPEEFISSKSLH